MKKVSIKKMIPLMVLLSLILLSGCAHVTHVENCATEAPYGFWGGLWHGIISPISFLVSLFTSDVAMYAKNNNGGWYDFGFVLGAGILFGGSSKAS
jgi:hypothetical protein